MAWYGRWVEGWRSFVLLCIPFSRSGACGGLFIHDNINDYYRRYTKKHVVCAFRHVLEQPHAFVLDLLVIWTPANKPLFYTVRGNRPFSKSDACGGLLIGSYQLCDVTINTSDCLPSLSLILPAWVCVFVRVCIRLFVQHVAKQDFVTGRSVPFCGAAPAAGCSTWVNNVPSFELSLMCVVHRAHVWGLFAIVRLPENARVNCEEACVGCGPIIPKAGETIPDTFFSGCGCS